MAAPRSERLKTDRHDTIKLARKLRAGEFRRVCVPDVEQKAMRNFSRWRQVHWQWLEQLQFPRP
jgi:transposase